jgi:tRNA threonylcarbamoyladenosine biosynthesis protein TsaB
VARLLAIDTSGETCSAALLYGADVVQKLEFAPRRHGDLILGMMARLLAEAGLTLSALDALAFGRGPGSFTGVRIATAVVQGAAFGAGLGVIGVSNLAALAQGQYRFSGHRRILTALDARMGELYWGCYVVGDEGLVEQAGPELVVSPVAVPLPQGTAWYGAGSGFGAYAGELGRVLGRSLIGTNPGRTCEAADIARLAEAALGRGEAVAPELALPVYLRDRVTAH